MTKLPNDLATEVLQLARARNVQIATAESCTGGMIIGALTEIAGSSDVVDRGFVTYSNAAKMDMLDVTPSTLQEFGAVSEQVAIEMARGALSRSKASITVSVTGIAGPGGSEHKPEGRVCFGLAQTGQATSVKTVDFGALGRESVRSETIVTALRWLKQHLS